MTFEEAKVREDYKFNTDMLKLFIQEIRNNYLHGFTAESSPVFGAAVMEIGFVDLEVNIASKAQISGSQNDMTVALSYFCCVKHSNGEWESENYISDDVEVNWTSENWRELLERDMFEKLNDYVAIKQYHFDKGND